MAAAALYIGSLLPAKAAFDRIVRFFLIFISIHAVLAFIVKGFFSGHLYIDTMAPFGLMYGPIIYFAFKSASGAHLHRKPIILHTLPFLAALILYLIFIWLFQSPEIRDAYLKAYHRCLYFIMLLSWIGYSTWAILYKGTENITGFADTKRILTAAAIILLTLGLSTSLFFYFVLYPGLKVKSFLGPWLVFGGMLTSVILAFRYNVLRILKDNDEAVQPGKTDDKKTAVPYQKSAVALDLLDDYLKKLELRMQQQRLYLNPELTADELASELKIPKHHLTQLFSRKAGMHFNQYINTLRIEHACDILKRGETELKLEELAFACGFNSKTSFNRNFKNHTGHTPSEYRELHKKNHKSSFQPY